MIIDKPGFYSSKAGKCEVKDIQAGYAIGWNDMMCPLVWIAATGRVAGAHWTDSTAVFDITGPYVEPRKPVEGFIYVDHERRIITPDTLPTQWTRILVREVEDT